MKLNKETSLSILRSLLTAIGAYLIGKNFFGETIDNTLWQGIAGALLTLIGTVWGIVDKTATIEMVQSGLRSVIIFVGSALVGSGVIKEDVVNALLEITALMVPILYSAASRSKSSQLDQGKVLLTDLKK